MLCKEMESKLKAEKNAKINQKSFKFKNFDGKKDNIALIAWISQLDDYFVDKTYSEKDKVK